MSGVVYARNTVPPRPPQPPQASMSGPQAPVGPPYPLYPYTPPPIIVRTTVETCNHCWCERAALKVDHAQCCKCGDVMHDQFVDGAS